MESGNWGDGYYAVPGGFLEVNGNTKFKNFLATHLDLLQIELPKDLTINLLQEELFEEVKNQLEIASFDLVALIGSRNSIFINLVFEVSLESIDLNEAVLTNYEFVDGLLHWE